MELLQKYFNDYTEKQINQFDNLQNLYKEWNEKINVISRKDIESLYERHVLHSLAIACVFEFKPGATIIDLGTGGGFPGVPLGIMFPEVEFILVDSIAKKLKVVDGIALNLGLSNITTKHSRVEDLKGLKVDFVVSRAVASLSKLWHWSKPLLKKNQYQQNLSEGLIQHSLICLKGGDLTEEIAQSNTKPRIWELSMLFEEPFFHQKYMLQVV